VSRPDPAAEQTQRGALETRPELPPPAPDPGRDRPLAERMAEAVALYPRPRSAIMPCLRLAQEEYGWLTPEAFEQVGEATGHSPAYCRGVASFYDMFRLRPGGRHEVCVCTSISCSLVGAADTLREFEAQLGVRAGETTPDGLVTLRTVECYGGCGWGPVVSVDERYHEPFPADAVSPLLERLRSQEGA